MKTIFSPSERPGLLHHVPQEWRPRGVLGSSACCSTGAPQNRVPLFLLRPVLLKTTADRQGTFNQPFNPELKPWAVLCSHFVAKSDKSLTGRDAFSNLFQAVNCQDVRRAQSSRYYRSVPSGQKLAPWSDHGIATVSVVNLAALIPGQRRTAGFLQRDPKPFFENQIAVELLDGSRIRLFVLSKFSFIDWLSAKQADEHVVLPL
jgi:hypothetical protein